MEQRNSMSVDNQSKEQRLDPRQRLPPEVSNNTPNLSPAERYISQQSQMKFYPKDTQSVGSMASSIRHAEQMNEWREEQINHIYQHEAYRYKYGTPPSSSSTFRRVTSQNVPSSSNNHARK